MVSTYLGKALAGLSLPRAEPLAGGVPQVERLAVSVVVDSFFTLFPPPAKPAGLEIERFAPGLGGDATARSLHSEFGLSLHLATSRNGESRSILLDFGYTSDALTKNLRLLGIAPESLDAMVLSHGHYDHFGGMAGFLDRSRDRLKPGLPLYLGGEECFCRRETLTGPKPASFGQIDRRALAEARIMVLKADQPTLVAGHAFTTGGVPRTSFEGLLQPTRMVIEKPDGSVETVPDDFAHEHATCVNVKDRGLVVITSCGHRGVVNSVKRALEVAKSDRLLAVMGGFHVAPQPEDYVRQTIAALNEFEPEYIIPMHCTGELFIETAARELPGKLVRSYTGSRYIFRRQ